MLPEGGQKVVYLVHDEALDRDCALSMARSELLEPDDLERFRREAQAMARLEHPNIVTVYEVGEEDGRPFFVCQYITGGDLRGALREAGGPLPIERALTIAEDLCHALAHAHARGIVHRDIKPGNILLTEDGTAKLGDFGLALAAGRTRLTLEGAFVGTAAYMAPEQAMGQPADARSDLYALGCVLYETLTGRAPFGGDDALAIISQHMNTVPVDPSWHNPEVPKPLEALALRLLAKSPDERPASAQEVAQELRRIIELSSSPSLPGKGPGDRSVELRAVTDLRGLDWGRFVGRHEEMEQLKDALDGALSGKAALIFVAGEPGIGKTRLAEEFAVYARLRGAHVLSGRAYEGGSSLPYTPFVEALRQYTRSRPDGELRTQLGPGAPEIATLVSEIRQRFPDIEDAPKLDPEAERLRLFESVTEFLRNASAAAPIVLHLDDLHWADKPTLLLLQHLAQRTARDRLLVLGAYRDVELARGHPLSETLGALRRLPNYRRVLLRGLPQDSINDLLSAIGPSEEGPTRRQALAAALYRETEGNPFFIREVMAHLVETGKIVHEKGGWVGRVASLSELGIPEGIREVIGRRLSRLSDGCNRMLALASTMTGGFTWDALKAIAGVTSADPRVGAGLAPPADPRVGAGLAPPAEGVGASPTEAHLLDLLEEALAAQLISERKEEGAGRYDFTHALIRQTLYEELSTPRRVLLHRQIGEALEKLYAANREPHLAELAHHFYQAAPGGDVEKAIDYARRAGDRAASLFAHEEAIAQYERALQMIDTAPVPDEQRRGELLLPLAAEQRWSGDYAGADETYGRALIAARLSGDAWTFARAVQLQITVLTSLDPLAPLTDAGRLLEEARTLLPDEDSGIRAAVLSTIALGRANSGDHGDENRALAEDALAMARRVGDTFQLANVLIFSHHFLGLAAPEARLAIAGEVIDIGTQRGNRRILVNGSRLRISDLAEVGRVEEARSANERMHALASEMRWPEIVGRSMATNACFLLMEGKFTEAATTMGQAFAYGREHVLGQIPTFALGVQSFNLGHLQGRLEESEPRLHALVQQYRGQSFIRCMLALAQSETGREDGARLEFEALAQNDFAGLLQGVNGLPAIQQLSETCATLGDTQRAAVLYEQLSPYAGRNIVSGFVFAMTGSASRQLGMMAAVMEQYDDAERHFEDALAFDQKMNARPWVAHDQYNYAKMLLARAAPGDRERALALLQPALDTAEALGMAKIIERGLALKAQAQGIEGGGT
jgi:tetratricopeptide (TPR) repeat protein